MPFYTVLCVLIVIVLTCFSMAKANYLQILHLTDIHYDMFFKPNASITSFCHRPPSGRPNEELSNRLWGRECDSSPELVKKVFESFSNFKDQISLVILSGDNIRHNNDDMIPVTRTEILVANVHLKHLFEHFLPGIPVIFSVGNNDVYLHDSMRSSANRDLRTLGDIWFSDHLKDLKADFVSKGYFSFDFGRKLRFISLNTLYFSKDNIFVVECVTESSPGMMQLSWLSRELESCRKEQKRAYIIGHIPPLTIFYYEKCLEHLKQVFKIYSDVIVCQLYGHIHIDDVFILKEDSLPVGFALASPALSPVFNPSYRILNVDGDTGDLVDYSHYYLPLQGGNFRFIKEYSCAEEYGVGPLDLEYFINMKSRELLSSFERIKRKRFRAVGF